MANRGVQLMLEADVKYMRPAKDARLLKKILRPSERPPHLDTVATES